MKRSLLPLFLCACIGGSAKPDGGTEPPPPPPSDAGEPTLATCAEGEASASPARLVRLSDVQWAATLAHVLGEPLSDDIDNPFRGARAQSRYRTFADGFGMPELTLEQLLGSSEAAAARLAEKLRAQTPCLGLASPTAECIGDAVVKVAADGYRRPLTGEEDAALRTLISAGLAPLGGEALELGLEAVFDSPYFLFRTELGEGAPDAHARVKLSPYELASALSYSLTDAPPDAELLAAAASGTLDVRGHAARLLGAPENAPTVQHFFADWFGWDRARIVVKDPVLFPNHQPDLLADETGLFVHEVLSRRTGLFANLFLSQFGYASAATAESNGILEPLPGETGHVEYPRDHRFGILTQPGFLSAWSAANETMPVQRGRFIRENVLCLGVIGAPPPNVPHLPEVPNQTMRERLAAHVETDGCSACHRQMDPIGLVLEQYDHAGRWRSEEQGKPVVTSGAIYSLFGRDVMLSGPKDLAIALSSEPVVRQCAVQQAFRSFMGRNEQARDGCSLVAAHAALKASDDDVLELVLGVVTSDSFLYREVAK